MPISRDEMAAHIRDGRARSWPYAVGRCPVVWTAAVMAGTWYAVMDGGDAYEEAPAVFGALLAALEAHAEDVSSALSERARRCRDIRASTPTGVRRIGVVAIPDVAQC